MSEIICDVANVSDPPNSLAEISTASSAPIASSSLNIPSAGGGPIVTAVT